MKIPDKSELKSTQSVLIAEILKASDTLNQSKDTLFDEFSRTLDSIVSKLRKSNDSEHLPATEARLSRSDKKHTDKSKKDLGESSKESKKETNPDKNSSVACDSKQGDCKKEISKDANGEKENITGAKLKKSEKPKDNQTSDTTEDLAVAKEALDEQSEVVETEKTEQVLETDEWSSEAVQEDQNNVAIQLVSAQLVLPADQAKVDSQDVGVSEGEKTQQHLTEELLDLNVPLSHDQLLEDQTKIASKELTQLTGINTSELQEVKTPELLAQTVVSADLNQGAELTKDSSGQDTDRSLENLILEKLLVGQVDPKIADTSKSISTSAALLDRAAQTISSNFAALAESVLLKNSAQNPLLKTPNQMAETATQQAAQGLQTINPTGMLNGSKSAEIADRRPENKESMKSLPRSLEVKTMERVENALKEVARSKDGKTISVRLDPPELGTVKIDVTQRDGAIHARLVAESPQVTNLLKDKAQEVIQMLRKLGLNVDKVSVSVGGQPEQPSQQFNQQLDSQVNDRRSDNEQRNSSNRSRKESTGQSGNGDASRVQHQKLNGVVTDHWVA